MKTIYSIILFFFTFTNLFATSPLAITLEQTTNSGSWTHNSRWLDGSAPNGQSQMAILIRNNITYTPTGAGAWTNPWEWKNQVDITVTAGATLTINANLAVMNGFRFVVQTGGTLTINGNFDMKNNAWADIDGQVYVTGNMTVKEGSSGAISGSGSLIVDGNLSDPNGVVDRSLMGGIERYLKVNNGNWSNRYNWSSLPNLSDVAITPPNANCYVFIQNNFTAVVDVASSSAFSITVDGGSSLVINPGASLTVSNNILNNGTIRIASTVSGSGGLIYSKGNNVNVKAETYIGKNEYHYLSSPIVGASSSAYCYTSLGYLNPNFYRYDETNNNADWLYGWTRVSTGNLNIGTGYALYSREDRVHSVTGVANKGRITVPITKSYNSGAANSWNLIGNPYPSAINADKFLNRNSAVLSSAVYLWDDDGSNGANYNSSDYLAYSVGGGINGPNGTQMLNGNIAMGQGFFVQSTTSSNVIFETSMQATSSANFFKSITQNNSANEVSYVRLSAINNKGTYNELLIKLVDDAAIGDDIYDAPKIKGNSYISFYSIGLGKNLAIQGLPFATDSLSIPLGIDANVAGTHTLSLVNTNGIDINTDIYLYDTQTNDKINLRESSYNLNLSGVVKNRFVLELIKRTPKITLWNGKITDDILDSTKWSNGLPNNKTIAIIPTMKQATLNAFLQPYQWSIEDSAALIVNEDQIILSGVKIKINALGTLIQKNTNELKADVKYDLQSGKEQIIASVFKNSTPEFFSAKFPMEYNYVTKTWDMMDTKSTMSPKNSYSVVNNSDNREVIVSGILNADRIAVPLYDGFQLVGNPYQAYLDFGDAKSTSIEDAENITTVIWTENENGSISAFNRLTGIGINGGQRLVAPQKSFWLYSKNAQQVYFNQNICTYPQINKNKSVVQAAILKVENNGYSDETALVFNQNSENYYEETDAYKLFATNTNIPQIYTLAEDDALAINSLYQLYDGQSVRLGFRTKTEGKHTISLNMLGELPEGKQLYINDIYANTIVNLSDEKSYSFLSSITEDTERFRLILSGSPTDNKIKSEATCHIYSMENSIVVNGSNNGTIELYDISGKKVMQENVYGSYYQMNCNLAQGVYVAKYSDGKQSIIKKLFLR